MLDAGIMCAGYDTDESCRFPFEQNNAPAIFHNEDVGELQGADLASHYPEGAVRILVGCAPCVTFSRYTQRLNRSRNPKWSLLRQFVRLVRELEPDIISMENVPELQYHSIFKEFLRILRSEGYHFSSEPEKRVVYCPDYGIINPKRRVSLHVIGSIERMPPTNLEGPPHRRDACRSASFGRRIDCARSLTPPAAVGAQPKRIRHPKGGRCAIARRLCRCHKADTGKPRGGLCLMEGPASPTITSNSRIRMVAAVSRADALSR